MKLREVDMINNISSFKLEDQDQTYKESYKRRKES